MPPETHEEKEAGFKIWDQITNLEVAVEACEGLQADEVEQHHASCAVVRPIMEGRHI